ncbi:hypothetical protein [Salmonella phage SSBI34]|nr:hypothetical protein [Salmonella phage SSBI34]
METKYFLTRNVYRLEAGKVYRWSPRRRCWLHRDGFTPADLLNGNVIGAIPVTELVALRRIVEIMMTLPE